MDLSMIFSRFWGPLDVPKSRFYFRKTAIFKVLHVVKDDCFCNDLYRIFGRFLDPFGTLFPRFSGIDVLWIFSPIFGPILDPGAAV